MSENPGPPSTGGGTHGDEQRDAPVDTGTGPNEADLHQESVGESAEHPEDDQRFDAG